MKWAFYVIVFVYMFYRAVYGVKEKDTPGLIIDVKHAEDGVYINAGERKVINCKALSKSQKVEWVNPNGQTVSRQQSNRVYATQYYVPSLRSPGPTLVLAISRASVDDTGDWECRSGDIVETIPICVMETVKFDGTPDEVSADEGRSFTLSCQAKGNPEPSISWLRDGEEISEDYSDSPKYRMMTKFNSQGIEGLLTIMSLTADDAGVYTCGTHQESALSKNHCSLKDRFNITLNINHAPEFEEEEENIFGKDSETLFIKCIAFGYPPPKYQWFKKDESGLTEYSAKEVIHPDNSSSMLQLKVTEDTYEAQYICRAANQLGEKEMTFNVLEPKIPEKPSQVTPTVFTTDGVILNVTWDDGILFEINEVEVQYLPYTHVGKKRQASPKENEWKLIKKVPAAIGEIHDPSANVIVDGLKDDTKYWVRVRVKNDIGASPWSQAVRIKTEENIHKLEQNEVSETTEEQENEEGEKTTEGTDSDDEDLPTITDKPQVADDSGKFYGLFFAGGVLIIAIGCSFLVRMV